MFSLRSKRFRTFSEQRTRNESRRSGENLSPRRSSLSLLRNHTGTLSTQIIPCSADETVRRKIKILKVGGFFVTVFSSLKVGVLTCLGTDLFDKLNSTRKEREIYLTYFSFFGFGLKFYGIGFFQSDSRRYSLHSLLKDYRSQRYLRQM